MTRLLRQNIIDELDFEPSINAANIGVAVEKGVVTLTGHVESLAEKISVERAVERIRGVRAIAQEIEVRYAGQQKQADDEIAQKALNILNWSVQVPPDGIKVEVENAWVTLKGTVEWQYQKQAAELAVRRLSGVRGLPKSAAASGIRCSRRSPKAARMVLAAPSKLLVDFGLRRAHSVEAGLMATRASRFQTKSREKRGAHMLANRIFAGYGSNASLIEADDRWILRRAPC